jgi:SOS-response transcriptional repressor LexA
MEWHDRLEKRRKELGWSKAELSRRAHVSYDNLNKYLRGDVEHPRGDHVKKMADAVGVTEQYLWFGVENKLQSGDDATIDHSMRRAPLYVWGDLWMLTLSDQGTPAPVRSLAVPEDEVSASAFFVAAPDDSNSPVFNEGDKMLCDPERLPVPGKFVIAMVNGQRVPIFGRYRVKDLVNGQPANVEIVPENENFPTIRVKSMSDLRIIGRIVFRMSAV